MLIRNTGCQTAREQEGRVQCVFLGDIIIIIIKHINNMVPQGGKLHLEEEKKRRSEEKTIVQQLTIPPVSRR